MLFPRQPPAPPPRYQFNQAEVTEYQESNVNEVREHELQEATAEIEHCQDEDGAHSSAEQNRTSDTKSGNAISTFTSFSIPSPSSLSTNVSYNSLNGNDRFISWSSNPSSEMIMKILQRPPEPAPPLPEESETSETEHNTSTSTAAESQPEEPKGESIFSKFNFQNIGLALFSSSPEEDEEEQKEAEKKKEEEEEAKKRESKFGNQAKNTKLVKGKSWSSPKLSKFNDVRQRPSIQTIPQPTRKVSKVETTTTSASSLTKSTNAKVNTHLNKSTGSIADKNKGVTKQSPLSLTKNKGKTQINSKTLSTKKATTGVGATSNNLETAQKDKQVITVPELEDQKHKSTVHDDNSKKRSDHRRNSNSLCSSSDSSLSLSSSSSTSLSSLTNSSSSSSTSSTSSLGQSTASLADKKANAQQGVNKTKELTKAADKMSFSDKSSQPNRNVEHGRHSQHSKHKHHHRTNDNKKDSSNNNEKRSQSFENMSLSSSTSPLSSTSSSSISSLSSSSLLPEQPSSGTAQSLTKSGKRKHKHRHKHKHKHHTNNSGTTVGSRRRSSNVGAKAGVNNGHDNEFATSSSSSFAANAAQTINATPQAPPVLSFRDRVHKGVAPPPRKRVIRKRNASEPRPRTNITGPVDTFRVGQGPRRSALARRNLSSNNKEEEKNVSSLSLLPERLRRRYFHVLLHVAQFWHNMMKVVLLKRQRIEMEKAIAPHAAFVIQCAWRRLQQRRRLGEYNAWGFLCPWIRLQHQRRKRALEHSARIIQNISRSAQARSWVHFLYTHKHRLAGLHVIARKVHVWEDEKLLRHMRYQRDERNLLITNWQQESNSLLREERANWLHIVNDFYNLKRINVNKNHSCEDKTTSTAKQYNVQNTNSNNIINHNMMSIDAMKVLPPFYEASALWCADTNLDLISRILSVESGEYLTCNNKTNPQVNNAIVTTSTNTNNNETNKQNADELDQTESMNDSGNDNAIFTESNSSNDSDSGKVMNDTNIEHDKITNESVRSAFLELLIQSESVERKQLSHRLLQEHDAFCTPVVLASRSIRYAQTASVPLLFAPLLLSFHSDYFLRRAVKLFCAEESSRNAIVDEYDALPLCNLHRPVLLAKAEERRLHLIHSYTHVEDESEQTTLNEQMKKQPEEQQKIFTREKCKTETVQNKEQVCIFNLTQSAINAQNVKEKETKTFTRQVEPTKFSATFPYINKNTNTKKVSESTPNDTNCSVNKGQHRPRPPTPPPRRRWTELTLPPLAHKAVWHHKLGEQKKENVLRSTNDAHVLNTYDGVIGTNANVREESNNVKNGMKRGKKNNNDDVAVAKVAADCCSTSSSSFVNVAATNSDAAENMLIPNMLFTKQPSDEFSFVSGELKKGADEKTSSAIHSSFCFDNSSFTSEDNKERCNNNVNNNGNEIVTTNISKIRDNVSVTNNGNALPILQNSNSVLFSASVEEYRNM